MESGLFGHVKGGLQWRCGKQEGLVEMADGGAAFFDEIGDLALELKVKLLRLIQERGIPASRRVEVASGGYTHRRNPSRSESGNGRGPFSPGPFLSAECFSGPSSAIARRAGVKIVFGP